MRVSVGRPAELGPTERKRWRQIQSANPSLSNPFLSVDFAVAVGRVRPRARVAILEDGGETVGFFAYEARPLRVGRALGLGVSDCQGIVALPGVECDPRWLLRSCGLDLWEFDHLPPGQFAGTRLHARPHPSAIVDLSRGYGPYLEERRRISSTIKSGRIAEKRRKMTRELGDVRFVFDVRDDAVWLALRSWKSAQYRRTGQWDRFSTPWVLELTSTVLQTRTPDCSGVLSMLYASDQPVAGLLSIRAHSTLCQWFPAYDVSFSKYSPGLLSHLFLFEAAVEEGLAHVDLGTGDEPYKAILASRQVDMAEGWIDVESLGGLVRRIQRAPGRHLRSFVRARPELHERARRSRVRARGLLRCLPYGDRY